MTQRKKLLMVIILLINYTLSSQSIIGKWETFDDKTNEKKVLIEIYQQQETYFAKIIKKFTGPKNEICKECSGYQKNKPIIGLVIIEDLRKEENDFSGGTILDPETGEIYKCSLELIDKNKLKVRGFIGFSLFGRTQYWRRPTE